MVKTDRNSAEDFCHPPGAVCTVSYTSTLILCMIECHKCSESKLDFFTVNVKLYFL